MLRKAAPRAKACKTSNLENQGDRGELIADDNPPGRLSLGRIYRFGTEVALSATARVVRCINGNPEPRTGREGGAMSLRRVLLCVMLTTCMALVGSAWAGTIEFEGAAAGGQGSLSFNPAAVGNTLTITPGGGGSGALITELLETVGLGCGPSAPGCHITGGFLTLTSGGYKGGGSCSGGACLYDFNAGGMLDINGTVTTNHGTSTGLLLSATFTGGSFGVAGTVGTYSGALSVPSIALHGPAFGSYTFTGGSGDAITISLNTGCAGGGSCIGLVDQASASLETVTAIAEPATLSVLGTGLFALGTGLRRKFVKA